MGGGVDSCLERHVADIPAPASACSETGWRIRHARSAQAEDFQIFLCSIPLPSLSPTADSYYWQVADVSTNSFSAKLTWEALRPRGQTQVWSDVIWFKGSTPSHAFMMWVAQLDRLPTRSCLVSWGLQIADCCCICNTYRETRDHLFLRCSYSEHIWSVVTTRLGYRQTLFHTWTAFISWLDIKDNICSSILRKLVSHATIYKIWQERNNRLHNNSTTPPLVLFKSIDRLIRDSIFARQKRKNFKKLMQAWLRYD
ncbi:uncharacterized protein LOC106362925 [Brassica napus]|uniref:uncharacterized protein LOC106362925 n=1 Tax=Brassica napus TaxID=3708 RepID=UPI0020790237|nr:uncharacterized protein LOC106362925 [Brassica napus]